jgi:hypothetical protein
MVLVSGFRNAGVLNKLYLVTFEYHAFFYFIYKGGLRCNIDDTLLRSVNNFVVGCVCCQSKTFSVATALLYWWSKSVAHCQQQCFRQSECLATLCTARFCFLNREMEYRITVSFV